ncbi:MAG: EAL domain-containing protein, partial [Pseudomonadota bacterium]|nr:EAL domain-containing protein [Pseudomonadota bacterium]
MAILARLLVLTLGAAVLTLLWHAPRLLGWDEEAALDWLAALQMAGPIAAATVGTFAAIRSSGRDRKAWSLISVGAVIYILANLAYIAAAQEDPGTFPTPADAAFFLMALLFACAVLLYGQSRTGSAAIDAYNFILLYGASIVGMLFLLHHEIKESRLGEFATVVAFLYPALWGSIAALGAVVLALQPPGKRRLPLLLLIVGMAFEGGADFFYAAQLMSSSYQLGGWPHVLWMISAAFIAWAAAEHALVAPSLAAESDRELDDARHVWSQALAPAAILLVVLMTGTVSGAFGRGTYQYLAGALTLILAIVVALREHWIVTTHKRLEGIAKEQLQRLSDSKRHMTSVLESTSDSVLVLDATWRVRFFNKQAAAMVPELEECGVGCNFWDLFRVNERNTYGSRFEKVLETGEPLELESYNEARQMWIQLRAYSTGDGISLFFRDISEQRRIRDEIEQLAHHDFLTGLYSRAVFNRRLGEAAASDGPTAVLLIDLVSFKEINDTLGHTVGDAVLVEVADRLRNCIPNDCLVARLGGDEFAVIAGDRPAGEVAKLAARIVKAMSKRFMENDHSLKVDVSIGIATTETVPAGLDLFTKADIALYEAKARHGGNVVVFEPTMEARLRERKELLADLARAVENNELEVAYQPLLDTSSRRTVGFEALVRWRHPVRGLVGPSEFIALAEESGLIADIGKWILRAACAEAVKWPPGLSVSVNLSTRQLADEGLVDSIVSALVDAGLGPSRLELEVTESALLREANLRVLQEVQDLGISLVLDDFGTGYSSLSYLQRFQFSKLKIDRSFIAGVPKNAKSRAIVSTVV